MKRNNYSNEIEPIDWLNAPDPMAGKVFLAKKCLCFRIRPFYDIELNRLDTPLKAYRWIVHLLGKNWITREALHKMVCLLQEHFGYNLHDFDEAGLNE